MTALRTIAARTPDVPEDQREELLTCHWRDLGFAYDWLTQAPDKNAELARLRYLKEAAERLEAAIVAYGVDPD